MATIGSGFGGLGGARLKPVEYVFGFPRAAEARAAESVNAATTGEANYA
ncbi:MAG TPA: hypothetical protein VF064_01440 [Pyrinomonadaceae bacterium]